MPLTSKIEHPKVKISSDDTTSDFLGTKLVAGTNVSLVTLNPASNETLEIDVTSLSNITQTFVVALPLTGVVDTTFNWMGELRTVAAGETTDYATDFAVTNNHISLKINSITGSGDVTVTGTSLSETTGAPVTSDTETITVDATGRCQSSKKWWEVTNIDIPVGISAINYDVEVVGYVDFGNNDYKFLGYRLDIYSSGVAADIGFEIIKVKDLGNKKWEVVQLESLGIDSGGAVNQIVDSLRTGGDDRSYNPTIANIWENNTTAVLKIFDFDTYFASDENVFLSSSADEGFIIRIRGEDGAGGGTISSVDFVNMMIRYELV